MTLAPRSDATYHRTRSCPLPGKQQLELSSPVLPALIFPLKQAYVCEATEMNRVLIVREFDPELHPIGYALTLEFLGEEASPDSPDRRPMAMSTHASIGSVGNSTPQHD